MSLIQTLKGNGSEIAMLPDSNFIFNQSMCELFKEIRGYNKHTVTDFETSFPLAFVILVDHDIEQFERLLRTIYRPQNIYCIHIDTKSSNEFKEAIESIISCFDNVFIPTKTESVYWAYNTLLKAQLNCMTDLLNMNKIINVDKYPRLENKKVVEWKYLVNAASTFLPLRTNLELTRIFDLYNGSSDVEISLGTFTSRWQTIWKFDFENSARINTMKIKPPPPHHFLVSKGSNYLAASRIFVDHIINSKYGKELTEWGNDMVIFQKKNMRLSFSTHSCIGFN
jgi:mucin type N-acetylglucosaminyltransferase 3